MSEAAEKNIRNLIEKKGFQFRDFMGGFEVRAKDETSEKLLVEGTPVVFESETELFRDGNNVYLEIIDKDAFKNCDMSDVIFNMNHGGRVYARTRNNSLRLDLKEDCLKMEAELWADDEGHKEFHRDIERGNLDKMSFAFTIKEDSYTNEEKDGEKRHIRRIKEIDHLYDVSAVDIPAYNATSISARAGFLAESEKHAAESKKAESRKRAEQLKRRIILDTLKRKRQGEHE